MLKTELTPKGLKLGTDPPRNNYSNPQPLFTKSLIDYIFTGEIPLIDEAWFYHYDPTIKQQSIEWKHPSSPTLKKAKTVENRLHVKRKRPLLRNGFLLHHNDARPHIARCVLCVSQQNNVEILPHPPYSPPTISACFLNLRNHYEANVLQATKHV
ncbi:hypothetical protein TNCV_1909751 [Trichonephila clavipes]|nr:hypothetical protein TNCV_1909751 [Trichonephila clavipes]